MPLQIRRGSSDERLAITPLAGELVFDTTGSAVFIGDGITPGGLPVTSFSTADARNVTAQMFLGVGLADNSLHTGISFGYANNRLIANVHADLTNYDGVIGASGFMGNIYAEDSTLVFNAVNGTLYGTFKGDVRGSVFADDSTLLIDGTNGRIRAEVVQGVFTGSVVGNVTGNVTGNISNITSNVLPLDSETVSIGSFTKKFDKLYLKDSATSLYIGNAVVGTNGGTGIALPAGSTIGGVAIGTGGIVPGNNYYISVKDSVNGALIDADNRKIYADLFTGPIKGNVLASNGTTVLVDSTAGNVPLAVAVTGAAQAAITSVGILTGLTSSGVISTTGSYEGYTENTSNRLASFTTSAASASTSTFNFRKSRGTNASPISVLAGDALSTMTFLGHDGTSYQTSSIILSRATGTIGTGIVPGQLEFAVADSTGALQNRVVIGNTGVVTVTGTLSISGNMTISSNTAGTVMSSINQYHATADANNINFVRGRGTTTAPVRVQTSDELADLTFRGYVSDSDTASSGSLVELATITPLVTGSVTATGAATDIQFLLHNGTSQAVRLQLGSDGVLDYKTTALSAGVGSGLVTAGSVATWIKVKLNGVSYAMPLYAIQA